MPFSPCHDVALLMVKEGARPDEISNLDWKDLELSLAGTQTGTPSFGMIHIRSGKTKNAKGDLPLTQESYDVLMRRFEEQGRPTQGWVFPAPTKSGHIEESSIRKQHVAAIKKAGLDHFELYCFRHTFLTVLGATGCDPYTLCRIAGHGDIKIGMRYCHTQNEYIIRAFHRMSEFHSEGCQFRCQQTEEFITKAMSATATQSNKTF
jgi:integrase